MLAIMLESDWMNPGDWMRSRCKVLQLVGIVGLANYETVDFSLQFGNSATSYKSLQIRYDLTKAYEHFRNFRDLLFIRQRFQIH